MGPLFKSCLPPKGGAEYLTTMLGFFIFDLDGTLVDCMPQHAAAFARVLEERCGVASAEGRRIYLDTAGQHLDEQFARALQNRARLNDDEIDKLVGAFYGTL